MSKPKAHLSIISHHNEKRIKVLIPYENKAIQLVKKIQNRKWSQSKQCWHLPYSKTSFEVLQNIFDIEYDDSEFRFKPSSNMTHLIGNQFDKNKILILPEHDYRIKVMIPYNRKDWIEKIKTIPKRAWNINEKYWSLPKTERTFLDLQKLFGEEVIWDKSIQNPEVKKEALLSDSDFKKTFSESKQAKDLTHSDKNFKIITQGDRSFSAFFGDKITIEQLNSEWLKIFVPYDKKGWIEAIRNVPGGKWNAYGRFWMIPYVQKNLKQIWKVIGKQQIDLRFKISPDIPEEYIIRKKALPALKFHLNDMQKKAIVAFEEKLMLENKAWRTIKTYKGLFTHFLAYFPNTRPSKISQIQIEQYIILKKQDNISDSQLNQIINALNCFFIRILDQSGKVVRLERPKKKRKLPNVFSLEEIQKLLKCAENLKHKSILILVYSAGLRRSEVLNLRIDDLNFDRKTIFVRNSKGGKDRYTFFSDVACKFVKKYMKYYSPKVFLFEGQKGGKYSESSIQAVFEKARIKANVSKNVTLHGLRHSFATHLIEKGVPLHVVQELLGHDSIKTTEIYLHISNKFRRELKSPLDDLEI